MMTDPIADMLTRMRNAIRARKRYVDVPASKIKAHITRILLERGYVKNVKFIESNVQGTLRIYLKYTEDNVSAIEGLKRVSMPSRRVYVTRRSIPRVMGGYGTAVTAWVYGDNSGHYLSAWIEDAAGRERGLGGEVLCYIW